MFTAGEDQTLHAYLIGFVNIQLGPVTNPEIIFVAPLQDDMLLGMDFHEKHQSVIDFKEKELKIKGEKSPIFPREKTTTGECFQVILRGNYSVEPNTMVHIPCKARLNLKMNEVKESTGGSKLLSPRILVEGKPAFNVCAIHLGDREVLL
ncbi:hypothetical protein PoB_002874600 [Plakobranchus ocellatus]|uniref:Uncharacterized protein n=1 Tax=Plakobranchus ocellatus TaxID=259542 RepID=A0AAV4A250_9GAST|nr:hypothetical protein PoB_002874600 [Plakobranchus ocellatus]